MGQIITTQNLVAIKVVRHAGQLGQYQAPDGLAPRAIAILLTIQDKQILVIYGECLDPYASYYFDQPYKNIFVCISYIRFNTTTVGKEV